MTTLARGRWKPARWAFSTSPAVRKSS
jgi:hypothetical protein